MRHFLFRFYGWIALFGGLLGIGFVLHCYTGEQIPLIGSVVATALGFAISCNSSGSRKQLSLRRFLQSSITAMTSSMMS